MPWSSFTNTDLKPIVYSLYEQATVEGIVRILTPFKQVAELLSGENKYILSMVVPVIQSLHNSVQEKQTERGEDDQGRATKQ